LLHESATDLGGSTGAEITPAAALNQRTYHSGMSRYVHYWQICTRSALQKSRAPDVILHTGYGCPSRDGGQLAGAFKAAGARTWSWSMLTFFDSCHGLDFALRLGTVCNSW
jgi:hypothetical protein